MRMLGILVSAAAIAAAAPAFAGANFYTDKTAFLAAAGTTSFESFESPISIDPSFAIYSDVTVHCELISPCLSASNSNPDDGTQDIAADIEDGITFGFNDPVTSFGIDVIGLGTLGFTSADLTMTTDKASSQLYSNYFNLFADNVVFAGVVDPRGFSVVTFTGTSFDFGDYVEYDSLHIGGAPVPEPAGWALMIGGVALAGAALRRQRTGAATA